MTGNINKTVSIKILAQPPREAVAAFKQVETSAAKSAKSVRDLAPTAKTTGEVLRKMVSDYRDGLRAGEVQTNRLARAIKEVGLSTKEVTALAAQMGRQWQLTGAQIDQALKKAGRMPMGFSGLASGYGAGQGRAGGSVWTRPLFGSGGQAGAGGDGARGGGMNFIGGSGRLLKYGAAVAAASMVPDALGDIANIGAFIHGGSKAIDTNRGIVTPFINRSAKIVHDVGSEFSGRAQQDRDANEQTARMQRTLEERARREGEKAEYFATAAPFRDRQRALGVEAWRTWDQAAGMRALDPMARRYTGILQREIGSGLSAGGAGAAFDRAFGTLGTKEQRLQLEDFRHAQGLQLRDVTRGGGRAYAEAEIGVRNARAEHGRAAQEVAGIRQEIGGLHPSEVAKASELQRQLAAATQHEMQTRQGIVAAMEKQASVVQGLIGSEKEMARTQAEYARNQARGARAKLDSGIEQFGHMTDEEREKLVSVSRALQRGETLSPEMKSWARGQPFVDEMLRENVTQDARADPRLREVFQRTAVEAKVVQQEQAARILAEVAVKIEQKMDATIKMDSESVAKQLSDSLLPQIYRLMEDTKRQLQTEMARARTEQNANRRAVTGSP